MGRKIKSFLGANIRFFKRGKLITSNTILGAKSMSKISVKSLSISQANQIKLAAKG